MIIKPEIIYHLAVNMDGYIATKDGKVDWLDSFQGDGNDADFGKLFASFDGLLLGSGTYEFALDYGQWISPDKPSWVFTKRQLPLLDPSIELTSETPTELLDRISDRGLKRLWLMGGGKLATAFRTEGLISEYIVAVIPIILGEGIPIFSETPERTSLELIESKSYSNGIVRNSYRPKP
jgi:dihydrofolate reductase